MVPLGFSILIVEDDALTAETIREYLTELSVPFIGLAHNKADAMQQLKNNSFHLVLLDIRMQGLYDGIEIGAYLSAQDQPFIYLTAHSDKEIAKRMMQTNARAYISKPIRKNEFLLNLQFVINDLQQQGKTQVSISNGLELIQLDKKDIICMKAQGNYLELSLKNRGSMLIRNTMENVLNELNHPDFVQTHRSYIVNKNAIEKISATGIMMNDQQVIPISRSYKTAIKELLA